MSYYRPTSTFGLLASKLHPQLPLSPRESQQLHELLTTSFRAHLDREHPVGADHISHHKNSAPKSRPARRSSFTNGPRLSSHFAATQHMDSILTNPLFSVKPSQASIPGRTDLNTLLQDPIGWFLDQIALGAADISKLDTCMAVGRQMLTRKDGNDVFSVPKGERTASTQIAAWLNSTTANIEHELLQHNGLLYNLTKLILKEGNEHILWRWFALNETRVTENSFKFRASLLRSMVRAKLALNPRSIDDVIGMYLHAAKEVSHSPRSSEVLLLANRAIVMHIAENPQNDLTSDRFDLFVNSTKSLVSKWNDIFDSSLQLHHPSRPNAQLAVALIQKHVQKPSSIKNLGQRKSEFLVQLYLGAARQLLAEKNFIDAHLVLRITQEHFPELVDTDNTSNKALGKATISKLENKPGNTLRKDIEERERKKEDESRNLDLLDRLLPI